MQKLQTLKGFRDFLPSKMMIRNEVIRRLKQVFEKYGFDELQTPSLEYQELLLGKCGEEAEKLMYLFQDPGNRKVGLRYDLTVPLARVVTSNQDLPKPFKRYQIQPAYRAENTQKGRYREIYQCDIDIVGSSSPISDAEILAVINDSLKSLGFEKFKIKINSRKILFSSMEKAGIPEDKWLTVAQSIDKLDKKEKDEVKKELLGKGVQKNNIDKLFDNLKNVKPDKYLSEVISLAKKLNVSKSLEFTPTLSRGLDYYTGPIFETVVEEPKIGSITGGGRYDKLLKDLGGVNYPAVGTSIGLDRVCDVIEELNLWPEILKTNSKVLVTIFSEKLIEKSLETAQKIREKNINTEIFQSIESLDKQLKYADKKGIPFAIIIGPEEMKENVLTLKDLNKKTQKKLSLEKVILKLSK
ncbi:histidine--tRNA ligase [Patescibacteria group bacterium]|nr:histidine--tRNA ligase [Patescibacteria group bacterium]